MLIRILIPPPFIILDLFLPFQVFFFSGCKSMVDASFFFFPPRRNDPQWMAHFSPFRDQFDQFQSFPPHSFLQKRISPLRGLRGFDLFLFESPAEMKKKGVVRTPPRSSDKDMEIMIRSFPFPESSLVFFPFPPEAEQKWEIHVFSGYFLLN